MNAEEKRIAREIKRNLRKARKVWRETGPEIAHVQVKLQTDGSYAFVSGPEIHKLMGRRRKVWAIRWGCSEIAPDGYPRASSHPHIAYGGFSWGETREEALEKLSLIFR